MLSTTRPYKEDPDKRIIEPVESNLEDRPISNPTEMRKIGEALGTKDVFVFRFNP